MRIAHLTDVYLPRLGGVELQVHDLAARQRARGHETVVLTTTPAPRPAEVDRLAADFGDVPVLRLGQEALGVGPYRTVADDDLLDALDGLDVDTVHVHLSAFSPLAWTAARLAGRSGRPTVVSVHSMWHDILPLVRAWTRWHGATDWPVRWAAVSTAAAAAVAAGLAQPGRANGVDGVRRVDVAVLPNGIDPDAWLLPAVPHPVPTVVSVGRMVRRKRPRELVRALLRVRAARPGTFRAVLVGDGPLLPALRREVAAAGARHDVVLPGALDRTAIRALLARADLYLAPAPRESFGIAALEARSAGLPVLARAGSGVADFVRPDVEGWFVGSDAKLGGRVAALLAAPDRLAAVAAHNRAVRPSVHWDAVLAAADALYAGTRGLSGVRR